MRIFIRSTLRVLPALPALALLAAFAPRASATDGAVYTMSNAAAGNSVIVLQRDEDTGALTMQTTVATGGNGTGASLGNQSSLVLTADEKWLLVVNPGSDSISSLAVTETGLTLKDTVPSGGFKPVSIDVHDDLVAVLNAGGDVGEKDTVNLFRLKADGTFDNTHRSKDLSQDQTSPAQVKFVQEGLVLVVTEKATNKIDTFRIRYNGAFKEVQTFDHVGLQPFGFTSVMRDNILVTDASLGTVISYHVTEDGLIQSLGHTADTNQEATCWVVALPGARTVFTTNTGSDSVTGLHVNFDADLVLLAASGISASTGDQPIDATLSDDGQFLYVLASGPDAIDVFSIADDGSLTPVETESGLPATANGMAAR
jgi:6-phosphogluconolactonase (cycloisomerase 2 family)